MIEDIESYIYSNNPNWSHKISFEPNDIILNSISNNSYSIEFGSQTKPLTMQDFNKVNPYFFLEFGFGLKGERKPSINANEYNWEYNINNWKGEPEEYEMIGWWKVSGEIGIGFMQYAIMTYKNKWIDIAMNIINEVK